MKQHKFLISGGGTGGHIYPAISIADELSSRIKNIEIEFVGAKNRMEMKKVPENGYRITGLWISGIKRNFNLSNLLIPFKIIFSLIKSFFIIRQFNPSCVIGTGGFASGPLLYIASKLNIPTIIQEQNSYPGITNKILSPSAKYICVAYPEMEKYFSNKNLVFTGNPVRNKISNCDLNREETINYFNLSLSKKTILFLGGSLGATKINEFVKANLKKLIDYDIQIIWQCGSKEYDQYVNLCSEKVIVKPFIDKMDYAYKASDIIISRAGASIISELCIVGKPVIFIPSPNVAEDHQTKNALSLVKLKSAEMIYEKELDNKFFKVFNKIFLDEKYSNKLAISIKKLGRPNASNEIVNYVLKTINYA